MNKQLLHPDYGNSDESYEKILLDESEKLYNRVIDDIISKTTSSAIGKNIWSFQPDTQPSNAGRESSQKLSTFTYKKEEQTLVQSEFGDEEENQPC